MSPETVRLSLVYRTLSILKAKESSTREATVMGPGRIFFCARAGMEACSNTGGMPRRAAGGAVGRGGPTAGPDSTAGAARCAAKTIDAASAGTMPLFMTNLFLVELPFREALASDSGRRRAAIDKPLHRFAQTRSREPLVLEKRRAHGLFSALHVPHVGQHSLLPKGRAGLVRCKERHVASHERDKLKDISHFALLVLMGLVLGVDPRLAQSAVEVGIVPVE